jgi:hypothetical protein
MNIDTSLVKMLLAEQLPRLAQLDPKSEGRFSPGVFDHFCLSVDDNDYAMYIDRFEQHDIPYQTYHHTGAPMKQVWVLDPNGVRVELNFLSDH